MKIFCDTSVLVAACVGQHPHFARAHPLLAAVKRGEHEGCISAHTLAELYSVLTSLPVTPRITPAEAVRMIAQNVEALFRMVPVTAAMYRRALQQCEARGLAGGAVYDALLIECARSASVDRIYTFNLRDFHRLAPDLTARIAAP